MNPSTARARAAVPVVAAMAIIGLSLLALSSQRRRSEDIREIVTADMTNQLTVQVEGWERALLSRLDELLDEAVRPGINLPATQALLRERHPWFDSVYVWTIDARPPPPGLQESAEVVDVFPVGDDEAMRALADQPCVQRARRLCPVAAQDVTPDNAMGVALDMVSGCLTAPLAVRLMARTEASRCLRDVGLHHDALRLVEEPTFDDASPWPVVGNEQLPVRLRVARRLLIGDLLGRVGASDPGDALLADTVRRAAELDAPLLEPLQATLHHTVEQLERRGRDVHTLEAAVVRADHRIAGSRELERQPLVANGGRRSRDDLFVADLLGDDEYALYLRPATRGAPGAAILLDQQALVEDFVTRSQLALGGDVLVVDVVGRVLHGDRASSELAVKVKFPATLGHLLVGFPEQRVRRRIAPLADESVLFTNLLTFLCALLGAGAIYEQVKASRRSRNLLQRQREFTTRVTHELKTPIAGIRVMAENLAVGAYRSEAQARDMAERIVEEADRLKSRVDEVLNFSRKEELPPAEPVDLEEVLLELLDEWVPRYEQAGVELIADFEPVDPVMGHHDALRDAVACLLDNALKYRREDVHSQVWLYLRDAGATAEIEVLDNGLGVPRDQREAVFERFVRVEGPNRGKAGGHGLGLAQVAEIAARHKGRVTCDDGVDGGARFILELPASGS